MSFSDNIEYLMAHPGTVAVLVQPLGAAPIRAGVDSWQDVLNHALLMMYVSRETAASDSLALSAGPSVYPRLLDPLPPEAEEEESRGARMDADGCQITRVRQSSALKHVHILTSV